MTLQTPFLHLTSWNNTEAFPASLGLGLQVLPLLIPPCQMRQMYALGSACVVPCTLCPLDIQGFDYMSLTRKVVVLHPAPLYCQTLPIPGILAEWCLLLLPCTSKFQRCKQATYPGELGLCGMVLSLPLSSSSTGCMPEVGAHGPEPRTHHSHLCTGGKV